MNNYMRIIIVSQYDPYTSGSDDVYANLVFDGNVEQFRACYFDNADCNTIADWAHESGWTVMFLPNKEFV